MPLAIQADFSCFTYIEKSPVFSLNVGIGTIIVKQAIAADEVVDIAFVVIHIMH